MTTLKPTDTHHLAAAAGLLELGNHLEANAELEQITPLLRAHPDVLRVRYDIYAAAKKWEACVDIADAAWPPALSTLLVGVGPRSAS